MNHRRPPILISVWWSFHLQYDPNLWANLSRGECFEVAAKGLNLILYPYDVQTIFGPLSLLNISYKLISSFLPTKNYEYPDYLMYTYLYMIPVYVSTLKQFIRPNCIVMYNGKDDLIENEYKMTILNLSSSKLQFCRLKFKDWILVSILTVHVKSM